MTSKEALEELVSIYNGIQYGIQYDVEDIIELFDIIKQDLERLEVLESNSNKVIKDSVKLINKNLELQQENEKLKKVISILKEHLHVKELDIDYVLDFNGLYGDHLTKPEYDLLKEVLDNE